MNEILIPISPGELLDKITILQIKAERISDPVKVTNVRTELDMLSKVWEETVVVDTEITALTAELKSVNVTKNATGSLESVLSSWRARFTSPTTSAPMPRKRSICI